MAKFNHGQVNKDVGARMASLRIAAGLSQIELGKLLTVTYQQVQKYESGKNSLSAGQLIRTCAALATTPNELLGLDLKTKTIKVHSPLDLAVAKHGGGIVTFIERLSDADSNSVKKLIALFNSLVKPEESNALEPDRKRAAG